MLSLFSGIGGIDLAAQWAGIETVAFCEINKFCQKVLKKHWPEVFCHDDITTLKGDGLIAQHGRIDVMAGGFPCQDISNARTWDSGGKNVARGIEGTRSGLWHHYARLIREIRPRYIVIENVKALLSKGFETVLENLADLGYDAEWAVVPASAFGAPHQRERIFILAYSVGVGRNEEGVFQSCFTCKKIRQASEWEFSRTVCQDNGKKSLPESFGIHDGVSRKLHHAARITALGNAVVPQQIYPIFKAIMEIEKGSEH